MEIKIVLDNNLLDNKDIDFFHYNCGYLLATCEYGTFRISSLGELKCSLFDDSNNLITSDIYDMQEYYIKNNDDYIKAVNSGKLVLDMNNWFSIEFFDNNGNYIESYYVDSVYGSISECLEEFKKDISDDEILSMIMESIEVE